MPSAEIDNRPPPQTSAPVAISAQTITTRLTNRTVLLRRSIWHAFTDLASNQVYSHASAIAFNALLSFFPFIVLLLVFCRKVLQWPAGYELILTLLKEEYLPAGGQFITRNLRIVTANSTTAIFSFASLIFTSAGVFAPIELALNRAWSITEERSFWRSRASALALVFACGLLAMGSIYVTAASQALLRDLIGVAFTNPIVKIALAVLLKILILPVTITIFFLIYYFLPNRHVPLTRVLPAAIFAGLLWELCKYFFVWCLPILDFASIYGPFYITVSLVIWAFISALILLLGANLSAQWPD
ncbi:MAG: YihY/virulence factor BrkB family protein [Acidobacteriota bacterium]